MHDCAASWRPIRKSPKPDSPGMTIRVLILTEYSDRGEKASLLGLKEQGVEIHLMCPKHSPSHETYKEAGLAPIDFAPAKRIDRAAAARIREYVVENNIDIVHTFNARAVTASIIALKKLPTVKLVAYRGIVGNLSFLDPMSWMRYLNRRIDAIICVAEAIRQFFLQMKPAFLAFPADRIVTIHKGHDLAWYQDPPAELSRFGISDNDYVIGCVANARPRKGIHVLIQAVERLPDDIPYKLLLIGNMSGKRIDQQLAVSSARERIVLAGYCKDAPQVVAACDVAALPSLRREGLPRGVIEAMAQGVPNVVTDSGGSPELIVPGESGLVVKSGDPVSMAQALERLYREPGLRKRMGEAARIRIRDHFHYSTTVTETLALYKRLLS